MSGGRQENGGRAMYTSLDLAIVILLSAIPFIECRGAMFYGFSVGIIDAWVYSACVLVNIAEAYAYPKLFARLLSKRRSILAQAAKQLEARVGKKISPFFFLFAMPMFGNGINTFSSTLISVWAGLKGYQKYVAAGALLTGSLTFSILSGVSFLPTDLAQPALKLLLCGYILRTVLSGRGWIMEQFGLKERAKPDMRYAAICATLLAICVLLLAQNDLAGALSQFFSLFYYSSSPGKLISFFVFLAAVFAAKGFLEPMPRKEKQASINALRFIFILLVSISLIAFLITLYFISDAQSQLSLFNVGPKSQYSLFSIDDNNPFGMSLTSFRENHDHILKAAAFLPVLVAFPQLDQRYAMSLNFYYRLPFFLLVALFAALAFIVLAMAANCCRFMGAKLALCATLSFLALASSIDAGLLSPTALAAIAGLVVLSLDMGGRLPSATLLAVFFFSINMHFEAGAFGIGQMLLRSAAMVAGFGYACMGKKPNAAACFAIAVMLGWPDARSMALQVAAALSTLLLDAGIIFQLVAFAALLFSLYLETWALPIGIEHSLMPTYISASALFSARGGRKAAMAALLAITLFAALPAYISEFANNNFDAPMPRSVAIFTGLPNGSAGWRNSGGQALRLAAPFAILEGLNSTLRASLALPEIYRHEFVCFQSSGAKEAKLYFITSSNCRLLFGDPAGELRQEVAETAVSLKFGPGNRENCIVEATSTGRFSKCRYIALFAFQNASKSRNEAGIVVNRMPGPAQRG